MQTHDSNDTFLAISRIVPNSGMKNYECDVITSSTDARENEPYWNIQHINAGTILSVKPLIPHIYEIHCENANYIIKVL